MLSSGVRSGGGRRDSAVTKAGGGVFVVEVCVTAPTDGAVLLVVYGFGRVGGMSGWASIGTVVFSGGAARGCPVVIVAWRRWEFQSSGWCGFVSWLC